MSIPGKGNKFAKTYVSVPLGGPQELLSRVKIWRYGFYHSLPYSVQVKSALNSTSTFHVLSQRDV